MAAKEEKDDAKKTPPVSGDAETTPADGEGSEGGKKSKLKKIILFVGIPLILLGGGGAGAYFTGVLDGLLGPKELVCDDVKEGDDHYDECQKKIAEESGITLPGSFLTIPDLIVNLNSNSKQPRFLKISIKLELENDADLKKMETVMPRVIDHFQTYLRELRIEDLKGSAGIYRLRLELLSRVGAAAPNIKVRDVLFQEILIQ